MSISSLFSFKEFKQSMSGKRVDLSWSRPLPAWLRAVPGMVAFWAWVTKEPSANRIPMIHEVVRAARTKKAYTQASLAIAAGLNERTIRRLETGEEVGAETLRSVCAVLEIPLPEDGRRTVELNALITPFWFALDISVLVGFLTHPIVMILPFMFGAGLFITKRMATVIQFIMFAVAIAVMFAVWPLSKILTIGIAVCLFTLAASGSFIAGVMVRRGIEDTADRNQFSIGGMGFYFFSLVLAAMMAVFMSKVDPTATFFFNPISNAIDLIAQHVQRDTNW